MLKRCGGRLLSAKYLRNTHAQGFRERRCSSTRIRWQKGNQCSAPRTGGQDTCDSSSYTFRVATTMRASSPVCTSGTYSKYCWQQRGRSPHTSVPGGSAPAEGERERHSAYSASSLTGALAEQTPYCFLCFRALNGHAQGDRANSGGFWQRC